MLRRNVHTSSIVFLARLRQPLKTGLMPHTGNPMKPKLIRATELAEFVYCSKAWNLKYVEGAEVSPVVRELQAEANAWHIEQGRSLARGDGYRWAGFAALILAIILVVFCWLGWAK